MYYTIKETRAALKAGETTSEQLVRNSIETFEKDKSAAIPLNAFIELYDDAVSKAQEADKEIVHRFKQKDPMQRALVRQETLQMKQTTIELPLK